MAPTILVTGFGPFPGAPFNPTGPLVKRLARLRPAGAKVVTHIFETSYAAVDRDLQRLIARHRPQALLMFGLAGRARGLRVETRARNELAQLADAAGKTPHHSTIELGGPAALAMPAQAQRLLTALRRTGVPARRSRDAGTYLCNYLCWRAAQAANKAGGPQLAAFVHVPLVVTGRRPAKKGQLTLDDLVRAGAAVLTEVVKDCLD
jgi:pyroglutamyl-peptidase